MIKKLKELKKKLENNSMINLMFTFIYKVFYIIVVILLIIVILQKVSNNKLSLFGYRIFAVVTESMAPKYEVGDVLFVKEVDLATIHEGDDVAYIGMEDELKDKVITHQVVNIEVDEDGEYKFTTRGNLNSDVDPEVKGDQIYGRIIHKFGLLSILCKAIRNIYAFYVIVFIPIGVIIYTQLKDLFQKEPKSIEEKDNKQKENSEKKEESEKNGEKEEHKENSGNINKESKD